MLCSASKNEDERRAALERYDVLDTAPEESFDRITRLAKTVLQMPIALVSLVSDDRQWFKSRQGLDATETPREISFCTHAIESDEPLIVRDALKDPRFRDNPLVLGEPNIRFYIGVPLRTPDGHNIGTLCAIDRRPREVSESQIADLRDLGRLVIDELELRLIATTDSLTGTLTRRSFDLEVSREIDRASRYGRPLSFILFDIDRFKAINDQYGHATGDVVLYQVARLCMSSLRTVDFVGRIGGEEFAVVLPETADAGARETAERLRSAVAHSVINASSTAISVTASFGVATLLGCEAGFDNALKRADAALYQAKKAGRNRTVSYGEADLPEVA